MTRMQFLRVFRKYALAVGVSWELAHPHILRHSRCSTMAAQRKDVYEIQRVAGRRNISSTILYLHISEEQADASRQEAKCHLPRTASRKQRT
jgi:site-specific recombinase XerD